MTQYDAVIVGGGHNALVAAAYLAQAGRSVLLLERSDHLGGAAISAQAFDGVDANLSRYSYLVSLLHPRIATDLGLDLRFISRSTSSYTPDPSDPSRGFSDDGDPASFARIGAGADAAAWGEFYDELEQMARSTFDSVLAPLPARSAFRDAVGNDRLWNEVFVEPIGRALTTRFGNDLLRGVAATDALIGTFADLATDLDANRCFLYHVLGGAWRVPAGGMGAVTGAMARAALQAGADLRTSTPVTQVSPEGEVTFLADDDEHTVRGKVVLCGAAPHVLADLLGQSDQPAPEGAQVKVNLLLRRLPRLLDSGVTPEQAFAGTFHANETYSGLQSAHTRADAGETPDPLPCEAYCHSLSDRSILGSATGHTMTVFGLHTPHRLVSGHDDRETMRDRLGSAVLRSLNSVLAEPIEDVIATDARGEPCVEVRTTADLQDSLAMPGGHIFHGPLAWPFAENDDVPDSPAQRWGVDSGTANVLLCGSGARRGGAVSGIGGHNAAMAALELLA